MGGVSSIVGTRLIWESRCTLEHVPMYLRHSHPFAVFESCCIQLASSPHFHFFCPSEPVLSALMCLTEFMVKIIIIT
jgi:hypothetical protein